MTEGEKLCLRIAGRMLAYPDEPFMAELSGFAADPAVIPPDCGEFANAFVFCAKRMLDAGQAQAAREYVAVFDHASAASPYLAWHRYGNDRGQGRALAALNGLYRAAGFEPAQGAMPDYLPRVLEFLSIAPDWACETLLDGFGPEMDAICGVLEEAKSPYARLLKAALAPLQKLYPLYFKPRSGPDPTKRPMARPEPETLSPASARSQNSCQGRSEI